MDENQKKRLVIILEPREKMIQKLLNIIQLYQAMNSAKWIENGTMAAGEDRAIWDKDKIKIDLEVPVKPPKDPK